LRGKKTPLSPREDTSARPPGHLDNWGRRRSTSSPFAFPRLRRHVSTPTQARPRASAGCAAVDPPRPVPTPRTPRAGIGRGEDTSLAVCVENAASTAWRTDGGASVGASSGASGGASGNAAGGASGAGVGGDLSV